MFIGLRTYKVIYASCMCILHTVTHLSEDLVHGIIMYVYKNLLNQWAAKRSTKTIVDFVHART